MELLNSIDLTEIQEKVQGKESPYGKGISHSKTPLQEVLGSHIQNNSNSEIYPNEGLLLSPSNKTPLYLSYIGKDKVTMYQLLNKSYSIDKIEEAISTLKNRIKDDRVTPITDFNRHNIRINFFSKLEKCNLEQQKEILDTLPNSIFKQINPETGKYLIDSIILEKIIMEFFD